MCLMAPSPLDAWTEGGAMMRSAHWNVEVFVDQDDYGVTYAEALLLTEGMEPFFARGTCRGTTSGVAGSEDAARIAAGALQDLAKVLAEAHRAVLRRPRERRGDV